MLAQSFLSPEQLGIPAVAHAPLIKVLGMLERGELHHNRPRDDIKPFGFNLHNHRVIQDRNGNAVEPTDWTADCGTVACFAGWADIVARDRLNLLRLAADKPVLAELVAPKNVPWRTVTPGQAAVALRNWLTTGKANWAQVLDAECAPTELPECLRIERLLENVEG
jgi:hypothetical protein